jgi:hypothetical protein
MEEPFMSNKDMPRRAPIRMVLLGAVLVYFSLGIAAPASAQTLTKPSAQLEAELSAKTADLNAAKAELAQIKAGITAINSFNTLPDGRLKREAKNQAYRAYLQHVEGLDPDLAPFANVVATPDEIKASLEKKISKKEKKISNLNGEIAQLQAKIQQAKVDELSQQAQPPQPGGSSGGTKSQPGPPQPSAYTAPPAPPPKDAVPSPPMLPPGAYLMGFAVDCPGEVAEGKTVRCTARGVYSHDVYTTVDLTGSTDWRISGAPEWRGGAEFSTKGARIVIVTATRGSQQITRTIQVKARKTGTAGGTKPQSTGTGKPAGGGGCGPGTSCKCAGGTTGHISCDTGKCHCGAG